MAKKTQVKSKVKNPQSNKIDIEIEQDAIFEEVPLDSSDGEDKNASSEQDIAALQAELDQTRQALKEAEDHALRLSADFINFRKRKEKEMAEVVKYANEDLVAKLLPILDNFSRTLDAMEKTDNLTAIKDGIAGVNKNMQYILSKIGLEPIEAIGQPFTSELHEVITMVPAADESQVDQVVDEIEKGYKLKDKVIRFSKVIVGE